jgi:hypothetical protein
MSEDREYVDREIKHLRELFDEKHAALIKEIDKAKIGANGELKGVKTEMKALQYLFIGSILIGILLLLISEYIRR